MAKLKEGDIYLTLTPDGGDAVIENGQIKMTGGFESYINICLFGANGSDFWAFEYMKENEKFRSEFIKFINENAKTSSNILKAEKLAQKDLKSFLDDKIADKVNVNIISIDHIKTEIEIEIYKNYETLFESKYNINWNYESGALNGN